MSLADILVLLRDEAKVCGARAFIQKYGLIPLSSYGVKISSGDLSLILKHHFNFSMTLDDLNYQLPVVCASLSIKTETATPLDNSASTLIWIYLI